jgi:DNA helicase II / ATP-dependent DNA helicase PcrA
LQDNPLTQQHEGIEHDALDIELERQRLKMVRKEIGDQMKVIGAKVAEHRQNVIELRRIAQENVSNDFSDVEPALEMVHHSMEIALKEMDYLTAEERLEVLKKLDDSAYFGRVDFRYEGEETPESIYIGISSMRSMKTGEYLIYDWRAPISSLFYDYSTGPAEFKTETDVVTGEIALKRQYKIAGGELEYMFDTGMNIGDAILQEMMGKHADERMKSIVATIQSEQNRVIRDDNARVLVVQGAAGSGKTSIAMQRIAYLLYKHRKTLSSRDILMITPNDLFASYIQDVLPELGEANVPQTTFLEFAKKRLGNVFQLEDMPTQMEMVLTEEGADIDSTRRSGIAWKSSPEFFRLLKSYIDGLERGDAHGGLVLRDVVKDGKVLISHREIQRVYHSFRHLPLQKRLDRVVVWLKQRTSELLEAFTKHRIAELKAVTKYIGTDDEIEQMARGEVKQSFIPVIRQVKRYRLTTAIRHYVALVTDKEKLLEASNHAGVGLPSEIDEICATTRRRLADKYLPYEDVAPILYAVERMAPDETHRTVKHVVVDEAQDLTPIHYRLLSMAFPNSRFTILGDIHQSIHPYLNIGDYQHIVDIFGEDATSVIRLGKSYRSTKEIVSFASRILGGELEIESIDRHGDEPLVLPCENESERVRAIAGDVEALLQSGHSTVAIICKTAAESETLYERLCDLCDVGLITKTDVHYRKRAFVIPSYLAKGLEFDAVIVANANQETYGKNHHRKLLYTVCSRALHVLHVYYDGVCSPFIPKGS